MSTMSTKSRPKKPLAIKTGAGGKPAAPRRDPLASLKMADMVMLKPALPAEVLVAVADYLDVPDLLRFAQVSRRMHEMVYDDARWISRLRKMGCWNDADARRRADQSATPTTPARRQSTVDRSLVNGKGRPEVLFDIDASPVARRPKPSTSSSLPLRQATSDGFDVAQLANPTAAQPPAAAKEPRAALTILQKVKSIRGQAREEYAKVYRALAPYYRDLMSIHNPMDSLIFRTFTAPEDQAQVLANVRVFSASDFSPGGNSREQRLRTTVDMFDQAALLEFRKGYEYKDIQGRMRQYARVMYVLNGGKSSVELFLHDNNLISRKSALGDVSDCIDYSLGYGELSLERVQGYFERLGTAYSQENAIVQAVFPDPKEVSMSLLESVARNILSPFLGSLFEDARTRGTSMYLRIISGTFAATKHFVEEYAFPKCEDEAIIERCNSLMAQIWQPHLETYLAEELAFFKHKADSEVEQWDRALSEQAASAESFFMSNVNRQADKKDFMSSFKKVVMMPINILPTLTAPLTAPFEKKPVARTLANGDHPSTLTSRSSTPNPLGRPSTPSLPPEAPSTELAAKAALMTRRLENIKSLFSMEVALNLVHAAKSSLERAAQFIPVSGTSGDLARSHCSQIFILLLTTVGARHVKAGFDKAIDHLSNYNAREAPHANSPDSNNVTVVPLATFLELVNVGDLIQQMLDVFYESELVRLRISNRDDFLDINVKEKKKFEAMLDERVAAGLGKGIDVLMDEVEYICATTQQAGDFYPESAGDKFNFTGEPTETARKVIALVGGHTGMLTGATEKTLLDVFTAEVGQRLFSALGKHIKRQRISTLGALPLLSDLSAYASFIAGFRNNDLTSFFTALREVAQIYLIQGTSDRDVNEMATIISDGERYGGVFTVEEVVEFAERRADWLVVRARVEGKVKGDGCSVM